MKAGVVVFPGSNCDHDCYYALNSILGINTEYIWHKEGSAEGFDLLVLPGGFSYGDYLRCGAIAKHSPVVDAVVDFAERGGHVLGICNGFQVLTETGLLPGALIRNKNLKFICEYVSVIVENAKTEFTSYYNDGEILDIPIAHMDGNYFIDEKGLNDLLENEQVVFRYCNADGEISEEDNPNGSVYNIAGVINKKGNILGMMPHPERCCEPLLGGNHGYYLFESIKNFLKGV